VTLVKARAPDAPFVALAAIDSVEMGGRTFTLIAGTRASDRFLASLARGDEMTVSLVYPGGPAVPAGEPGAVMRALDVPLVDSDRGEIVTAAFRVTHDTGELRALRSNINRWFGLALLIAIVMTILLGSWLTTRISRPLVELADKTSRIDLDRLDVEFDENGGGEIGVLSRVLGAMTNRLRASAVRIKDAERRATLGELARQVNHDIKNGLTPIRNVLRHLDELARTDSGDLSRVFRERKSTLDGGMSYLENLATNYARLSRKGEAGPCDVDAIVHQVVQDLSTIGRDCVVTRLGDDAHVIADPVSLRRVIENLVNNAIESLDSPGGRVVVTTEHVVDDEGSQRVRITVEDTGHGMSEEVRSRIFDDFYTTKDSGTGLGLSIVRRLVMDLDGTIGVESEKGRGSRFVVDLPHAGVAARGRE
jgi:signal transduction histidine kinase